MKTTQERVDSILRKVAQRKLEQQRMEAQSGGPASRPVFQGQQPEQARQPVEVRQLVNQEQHAQVAKPLPQQTQPYYQPTQQPGGVQPGVNWQQQATIHSQGRPIKRNRNKTLAIVLSSVAALIIGVGVFFVSQMMLSGKNSSADFHRAEEAPPMDAAQQAPSKSAITEWGVADNDVQSEQTSQAMQRPFTASWQLLQKPEAEQLHMAAPVTEPDAATVEIMNQEANQASQVFSRDYTLIFAYANSQRLIQQPLETEFASETVRTADVETSDTETSETAGNSEPIRYEALYTDSEVAGRELRVSFGPADDYRMVDVEWSSEAVYGIRSGYWEDDLGSVYVVEVIKDNYAYQILLTGFAEKEASNLLTVLKF